MLGGLCAVSMLTATPFNAKAQAPAAGPPVGIDGVGNAISGIVSKIDESVNLFTPYEVEFRIGAAYVQKSGEAGTVLAIEKWDVLAPNLGFGIEAVQSGQDAAAEFGYVAYRKVLGNVAGSLFVGGGYSEIDKRPMGVVGARLEYRTSKHLGIWTSVGEGIEFNSSNRRGLVTGAGITYSF